MLLLLVYLKMMKKYAEGYEGTAGLISNPIDKFKSNLAKGLKEVIIKDLKTNGFNSNK